MINKTKKDINLISEQKDNWELKIANRQIESFRKNFGKSHFMLACYAAFPISLTPDLLYCIWDNFKNDVYDKTRVKIPWIAVSDLLLSNLFNEVGYELYEMDLVVRQLLLNNLKENFGQQGIDKLSNFLLVYIEDKIQSYDPAIRDFAKVQRWTALAYQNANIVAQELTVEISNLYYRDKLELFRIASIIETVAEPLRKYEYLINYARGITSFIRGHSKEAKAYFYQVEKRKNKEKIASISLPIPEVFGASVPSNSGVNYFKPLLLATISFLFLIIIYYVSTFDDTSNIPLPEKSSGEQSMVLY